MHPIGLIYFPFLSNSECLFSILKGSQDLWGREIGISYPDPPLPLSKCRVLRLSAKSLIVPDLERAPEGPARGLGISS